MTILKMKNIKTTFVTAIVAAFLSQNAVAGSTMVTDAVGTQELWTFQEILGAQKLVSKTNQVDGKGIVQTWDANGNLLSRTDEEGRVTEYTYNANNQRTSMIEAAGTPDARITTYEYVSDEIDLVTKTSSPSIYAGNVKETINTYDANLNITAVTINGFDAQGSPVSRTTTFDYDAFGKVIRIDGPRTDVSDITTFDYYDCNTGGECGQLARVTNALGHETRYTDYDLAGRLLQSIDANGVTTQYAYHPRGWVLAMLQDTERDGSRITGYEYDNVGQLTKVTMPDGTEQSYVYDAAHDLREISDNVGNKVTYLYDAKGNRTHEEVYDPSGNLERSTVTTYNHRNFIESINNGGSVTQMLNDAVGNLSAQTDPNANPSTQHDFDALDRLTNTVDALTNNSTYAYNVADQLTEVIAPNGAVTQYEYDDLGNQTKEISADRGTIQYTHDDAGNVTSMTDARGITTSYQYDVLNRVTNVIYPNPDENITYTYDAINCGQSVGRLCVAQDDSGVANYQYDAWGNVLSEIKVEFDESGAELGTFATLYEYDAANRVTGIQYPSGRVISITRDVIGRLIALDTQDTDGTVTNIITTRAYRADGLWNFQEYGNDLSQLKLYDQQGRLQQHIAGDYDFYLRDYQHDANGNILSADGGLPSTDGDLTSRDRDYQYDVLDRLTQESDPINNLIRDFQYDANGNREQFSEVDPFNSVSSSLTYTANSNRLNEIDGSPLVLDASGRTLRDAKGRQYVYNNAGRIQRIVMGAQTLGDYVYNHQQLRTQKQVGDTTTIFQYDLAGNLIAESDGAGNTLREYIYADGERVAAVNLVQQPTQSTPTFEVLDVFQSNNYDSVQSQSSTGYGGHAQLAMDGNTSGFWGDNSTTHTTQERQPWWQVDFGYTRSIGSVRIHNRTDCCTTRLGDFYVFVSDKPFADATLEEIVADSSIARVFHAGSLTGHSVELDLSGVQGRYLRVQIDRESEYLSLAEVEVFDTLGVPQVPYTDLGNIALNQPTLQSSIGWGGVPSRAVDGIRGAVTHTALQAQPWWQVDLGGLSTVEEVRLFNRGDCCRNRLSNFYVLLSDTPFPEGSLESLLANASIKKIHFSDAVGVSVAFKFVPTTAQYVRVQLAGDAGYLSLAEVEVIGKPADNTDTGGETQAVNEVHYYVNDHLMTPQLTLNEAREVTWQADYSAFGKAIISVEEFTNNHRFPGQYYDAETGLYYNWNRYYDPEIGRYVTSDPIGLGGGLNTFGYALANPQSLVDPNGAAPVTARMLFYYWFGGGEYQFVDFACDDYLRDPLVVGWMDSTATRYLSRPEGVYWLPHETRMNYITSIYAFGKGFDILGGNCTVTSDCNGGKKVTCNFNIGRDDAFEDPHDLHEARGIGYSPSSPFANPLGSPYRFSIFCRKTVTKTR